MKLSFNVEDAADKRDIPNGVYLFRIAQINERKFSTGTEGMSVQFDVFLDNKSAPITVWENMYYAPKALWKLRDMCKSVGVEFKQGLDSEELLRKSGRAFFHRKKGDQFLSLEEFIIPKDGSPPDEESPPIPAVMDDDISF